MLVALWIQQLLSGVSMIVGSIPESISKMSSEEIIRRMKNSNTVFHLTGSRFFGGAGPASDWDFFVDNNDGARAEAKGLGFRPMPRPAL